MTIDKRDNIIKQIKSKGYWEVNIYPTEYKKDRIAPNALQQIIEKSKVSLRGWDYPHVFGRNDENERGPYAVQLNNILGIEKYITWNRMIEFWRFTQSGNFYHLFAVREDYDDEGISSFRKHLSLLSTLYTISEIFEFTRRLFTENIFISSIKIEINLYDLKERKIITRDPGRFIPSVYTANIPKWSNPKKEFETSLLSRENLENLILDTFSNLIFIFNWQNFSKEGFRNEVRKFLSGKIF